MLELVAWLVEWHLKRKIMQTCRRKKCFPSHAFAPRSQLTFKKTKVPLIPILNSAGAKCHCCQARKIWAKGQSQRCVKNVRNIGYTLED